jgi:ADP-ribose pyrophosphatase
LKEVYDIKKANKTAEESMWQPKWQEQDVEILKSLPVYQGHHEVVQHTLRFRQFDGEWGPLLVREHVLRQEAAMVVLYDPEAKALVLIEQFRVGPLGGSKSPWLLEFVAGLVDENETPDMAIRREALEEAGCEVGKTFLICRCYPSPGGFSERTSIYYAPISVHGLAGKIHGLPDEGENIKVHVFSLEEAAQWISTGQMTSATTILGIQWLLLNQNKLPA